jgi:hypothetical protein
MASYLATSNDFLVILHFQQPSSVVATTSPPSSSPMPA